MTTYRLMIKKLLLLTGLTISTSLLASPMDDICNLLSDEYGEMSSSAWTKLENKCERNNILQGKRFNSKTLTFLINSYCRFDRNVWYEEIGEESDLYNFGCVLYAPEGRA